VAISVGGVTAGETVAEHRTGVRDAHRMWWVVGAFVAVPTALAALALVWPGPRIAEDLRTRSEAALEGAGLTGAMAAVEGRDVRLSDVPAGAEQKAAEAVAAVPGVRAVRLDVLAPPAGTAPVGTAPTASVPTAPADAAPPAPDRLETVLFAPDAADLDGPALAAVQQVAALLARVPDAAVVVEGHVADTPGGFAEGRLLAQRRAAAVADALVAAGVDRGRITARGRGAEQPLATAAQSRRAEISVRYG
jgi:outer membrane protein OmpA-like peptidoglycan-associated protein